MTTPDIRTTSLKSPVDVAEYLFTRLHQLGVRSVHGLPGDYNLVALDYLPNAGLKWVGNVNELNAGPCSKYQVLQHLAYHNQQVTLQMGMLVSRASQL